MPQTWAPTLNPGPPDAPSLRKAGLMPLSHLHVDRFLTQVPSTEEGLSDHQKERPAPAGHTRKAAKVARGQDRKTRIRGPGPGQQTWTSLPGGTVLGGVTSPPLSTKRGGHTWPSSCTGTYSGSCSMRSKWFCPLLTTPSRGSRTHCSGFTPRTPLLARWPVRVTLVCLGFLVLK